MSAIVKCEGCGKSCYYKGMLTTYNEAAKYPCYHCGRKPTARQAK